MGLPAKHLSEQGSYIRLNACFLPPFLPLNLATQLSFINGPGA